MFTLALKLSVYAAAQLGLAQLESNPERQLKYIDFIDHYSDLTEQELQEYRERYLSEEGEIMGLAQLLRQEGRQEGEAIMLLRLLEKRFGRVPDALRDKIHNADPETLLNWSERVLTCDSLDTVFH